MMTTESSGSFTIEDIETLIEEFDKIFEENNK